MKIISRQTIGRHAHGFLRLSGSNDHFSDVRKMVLSPYFQMADLRKEAPGRNTPNILAPMTLKALITGYDITSTSLELKVFFESDDATINAGTQLAVTTSYTDTDIILDGKITALINNFCSSNSLPTPTIDWMIATPSVMAAAIAAAAPADALVQSATRSIVTGTGATGFQVSSTRNTFASYNVTVVTTASIGGNASGTVVLEVAPTNSATAGDWVEIARFTNGQAITLALALQSVQTLAGQVNGMIKAGYYAKLRSINNSGTPTYTYNSGQEILQ